MTKNEWLDLWAKMEVAVLELDWELRQWREELNA